MSLIINAAHFAAAAHGEQRRKYSETPYIWHPARVAGRVALLPNATEEMIAAAYLHDVLEDTPTTVFKLEELFGSKVTKMVIDLTNVSKGSTKPRAERKKMDFEYLSSTPPEIKQIKLLDRIDNLREMQGAPDKFGRLYCQESRDLSAAIGLVDTQLNGELLVEIYRLEKSLESQGKG